MSASLSSVMEAEKAKKKAAHGNEASGFPFRQSRLVNRLGVSIDVIREAREGLVEGVDWMHRGQVVLFSQVGVDRLAARLKVNAGTRPDVESGDVSPQSKRGPIALLPERASSLESVVAMRVVAIPRNPHLVVCVPADGAGMPVKPLAGGAAPRANVKVQSNVNFVPGMLLKARPAEVVGMFNLVGRCPRFRGKF